MGGVPQVAAILREHLSANAAPEVIPPVQLRPLFRVQFVLISDTHGHHRKLSLPPGDVLIHAGDFTAYGKAADAEDFNAWLGEQPHKHKFVVLGNHEANAPWRKQ